MIRRQLTCNADGTPASGPHGEPKTDSVDLKEFQKIFRQNATVQFKNCVRVDTRTDGSATLHLVDDLNPQQAQAQLEGTGDEVTKSQPIGTLPFCLCF